LPFRLATAVWLIVWLELFYGVVDDVYLIARGYGAAYIIFIVIHLAIIGTGVMFAREASAKALQPSKA